jgi:putative aminopeptidase FrvX
VPELVKVAFSAQLFLRQLLRALAASRALGDRAGIAAMCAAGEKLKEDGTPPSDVYLVCTTEEENGGGGGNNPPEPRLTPAGGGPTVLPLGLGPAATAQTAQVGKSACVVIMTLLMPRVVHPEMLTVLLLHLHCRAPFVT